MRRRSASVARVAEAAAAACRCSTLNRRVSSRPKMWSAWLWVYRTASTRAMPNAQRLGAQVGWRCRRASRRRVERDEDRQAACGVARVGPTGRPRSAADHRHAVRRAGAEEHDAARQAVRDDDAPFLLAGLDEAHPQLVEQLLDQLLLVGARLPLVLSCSIARMSIICAGRRQVRLVVSPVTGSAMSPKCTAAVVASDMTNAVKVTVGSLAHDVRC